ncbi:MAG TPA: amidohydrolase family protein [Candidatus Solibacter sp.]|nr:amidohydrolase family protein [Candidatus Solibacter sp.]
MRRFRLLNLFLLTPLTVAAFGELPAKQLVIAYVTVIDVSTGKALPDRNVVIQGDRITAVEDGTSQPEEGATIIDGHGKFVIPGLWDTHVHLTSTTECALPLLVATGITNVRDMGGRLMRIDDWRSRIAAGILVGPHIVRVGPTLNGTSFNSFQMVAGGPEATRGAIRALQFIGVDAIKVHRRLPRASYFAAADEAKKLGIPLVGHVPIEVTPAEASDAGQATLEHTQTLFEGTFSTTLQEAELPGAIERWLASSEADALFAKFVRNGTWVTPTLEGYVEMANLADPSVPRDARYRYVASSQRREFEPQLKAMSPKDLRALAGALEDATARMHRDGVMILAGTDAAGPRLVGFSLHQELIEMIKIGMTPAEALQTATLNPARAFGKAADFGAVEPGRVANLVLLDGNPLDRIENTQRIAAVVLDGKAYQRPELDRLLVEAERLAAQN